jgi:multidrug efflux system membrane fusion protein
MTLTRPTRSLLLALAAAVAGCAKKQAPPPPPVPVTVAPVERRDVPYTVDATGTVEPIERVAVESQVSGILLHVGFREGDEVQKGQVLFEIDPRPFRATLAQAEAALARDRAQAANAAQDEARYAALAQKEYVTAQQAAQAKAQAASLAATVQADEAAVESARLNLQYATIRAPISGRAGSLTLREGNLVKSQGTTLVTINQLRPILVRFSVPSQHLARLQRRPMKDVSVTVQSPSGGPSSTGALAFIDNAVDTSTGTLLLKAQFPNADGALWPGEYVNVNVRLDVEPNALVVPAVAVTTGQQGSTVFTVDGNNKATTRPVRVIRTQGDLAVIESDLKPGDRVVTDGQLRITPGATVQIRTVAPAAPRAPQEAS